MHVDPDFTTLVIDRYWPLSPLIKVPCPLSTDIGLLDPDFTTLVIDRYWPDPDFSTRHQQILAFISCHQSFFPYFGNQSILDQSMLEIYQRQKLQYI